MADELCISCDRIVSPRQHAITCDLCDRWQHRTCDTGTRCLSILFIFRVGAICLHVVVVTKYAVCHKILYVIKFS